MAAFTWDLSRGARMSRTVFEPLNPLSTGPLTFQESSPGTEAGFLEGVIWKERPNVNVLIWLLLASCLLLSH